MSIAKKKTPSTLEAFAGRVRLALIRLGDRRGRKFYSAEFARALDVPPMTFNAWENGKNEPSLATILWLAGMLGVTPGWLAFGQPPERADKESPLLARERLPDSVGSTPVIFASEAHLAKIREEALRDGKGKKKKGA